MARPAGPFATALLLSVLVAAPAVAQDVLPVPIVCWDDVRVFDSFTSGTVDYCRAHLRYLPGALECYRMIDRICSVYFPLSGEVTDLRQPRTRIPFPCPTWPEPPVCRRLDLQ